MESTRYDVLVVGAGPNGLAAAIEVARAGLSVLVIEAEDEVGGGARTAELTLPGFLHDPCSAVHPLAAGSPFLSSLPLERYGLGWIHSPAVLAHPFDDRPAAILERSVDETVRGLGPEGERYRRLIGPLVRGWPELVNELLQPLHRSRAPLLLARFGARALRPAHSLARRALGGGCAAAMFAGNAAHSALSLDAAGSAAIGLVLMAAGHAVGWPIPAGGSGRITAAMASLLLDLGGSIRTGWPVRSLDELPPARAILLDLTPKQVLSVAGPYLPERYRRRLARYRYGPGAFKVDWALAGPIPWRDPACARAATVHLGGTLEEIGRAMRDVAAGRIPIRPFTLLAQPSLFDSSRAPPGRHTAWAYCHLPNGSRRDMTAAIEAQVERFAPGFRDLVLARSTRGPAEMEAYNPNLVGGDVNGGSAALLQMIFRPIAALDPYRTPAEGLHLCSASTPPGGGVHGMCGYHAARSALHRLGVRAPDL